jgi:tRNA pseudouridine55 synthase
VVAAARRLLHEPRIGHTGTLDPLATGVLPLACGRATRLVRFLTASTKDYEACVRFGVTTDSFDVTGNETSRSDRYPTEAEVEAALGSLRGEYLQTPPAFSAKKVGGRRAYALARQQQPVAPAPVPVCVTRAELVQFTAGTATILITCSAGFYVRSFAHTLGEIAGTGACLVALRRTRSGEFGLEQAIPLAALHEMHPGVTVPGLVPLNRLLCHLPAVTVSGQGRTRVQHGRALHQEHVVPGSGVDAAFLPAGAHEPLVEGAAWVRVLDEAGALVAMATRATGGGTLQPAVVLI